MAPLMGTGPSPSAPSAAAGSGAEVAAFVGEAPATSGTSASDSESTHANSKSSSAEAGGCMTSTSIFGRFFKGEEPVAVIGACLFFPLSSGIYRKKGACALNRA